MSAASRFFAKCVYCKQYFLKSNLHQHIRDEHS